jgi:hypothetical protein
MIQTPTIFKCITYDNELEYVSANQIESITPLQSKDNCSYIKVVIYDGEFQIKSYIICLNIEVYNVE